MRVKRLVGEIGEKVIVPLLWPKPRQFCAANINVFMPGSNRSDTNCPSDPPLPLKLPLLNSSRDRMPPPGLWTMKEADSSGVSLLTWPCRRNLLVCTSWLLVGCVNVTTGRLLDKH